jgi:hypothetical protein
LTLAKYYNPDWSNLSPDAETGIIREPHDHEFFTFVDLGKLAVRVLDPVSKVKQVLSEKLSEYINYPELKDVNSFRLREKLNDKLV